MKKLGFTFTLIFLFQISPLLGVPRLLLHWKMLAIITIATTLWLSQPALHHYDVEAYRKTDRYTVLLILAMAGLSTIVPEVEWAYLRENNVGNTTWNVIGFALMAGGTIYRIWAIRTLGQHFTTTVQTDDTQVLITKGPYRHLRHPSYLGAFVAIVGCAILLQAWIGVLVSIIAMLFAYIQRINAEEIALSAHFGKDYQIYKATTWRMLPMIW